MSETEKKFDNRVFFYKDHLDSENNISYDDLKKNCKTIQKIVIGELDKGSDTIQLSIDELKLIFSCMNLTHLYLWNCEFEELPSFSQQLKVLDLRNCKKLKTIDFLPSSIETIDIGGCESLKQIGNDDEVWEHDSNIALRWCHVDGCDTLNNDTIEYLIRKAKKLEEFTATDCLSLSSLRLPKQNFELDKEEQAMIIQETRHPLFPPYHLKRLVLDGCSNLVQVPDLSGYRYLHHLNLNECVKLTEHPKVFSEEKMIGMPPLNYGKLSFGIRYLLNYGCDDMKTYGNTGLDVRAVHRSSGKEENVADIFRAMNLHNGDAQEMLGAKLLLLGSGRCGKTTFANALRCFDENPVAEADPFKYQGSTEKVKLINWENTKFIFENNVEKRGNVCIWDFGGQEIYHNTHQMFISEGSVFVIVTTTPEEHDKRVKEDLKRGKIKKENEGAWKLQNEYRELKYWLDYIRDGLGFSDLTEFSKKGRVLILHTGDEPEGGVESYLKRQAGSYIIGGNSGIPIHKLNTKRPAEQREKRCKSVMERIYLDLRKFLGDASDQMGISVSSHFKTISEQILVASRDLAERRLKSSLYKNKQTLINPILTHKEWNKFVCGMFDGGVPDIIADGAKRFLHHSGQLLTLEAGKNSVVVLDQQWALDIIYSFTDSSDARKEIQENCFTPIEDNIFRTHLNNVNSKFRDLNETLQGHLVNLIDYCGVCVQNPTGKTWIAVQRELLPEYTDEVYFQSDDRELTIEDFVIKKWMDTKNSTNDEGTWENHCFAIKGNEKDLLGASDYRAVCAFIIRRMHGFIFDQTEDFKKDYDSFGRQSFDTECVAWRTGIFFVFTNKGIGNKQEQLALRIDWSPLKAISSIKFDSYEGGIFFQLLTPAKEVHGKILEDLLLKNDGPLSVFSEEHFTRGKCENDARRHSLLDYGFPALPGFHRKDKYEIAISYNSEDSAIARMIYDALNEGGKKDVVYIYQEGAHDYISGAYDVLKYARQLVIVASKNYFTPIVTNNGKVNNRYCPVELADAILCSPAGENRRSYEHLSWVLVDLTFEQLQEQIPKRFSEHLAYIDERFGNLTKEESTMHKRERTTFHQCRSMDAVHKFLEHREDFVNNLTSWNGAESSLEPLLKKLKSNMLQGGQL